LRLFRYGDYDHTFQTKTKVEIEELETEIKVLDHGYVRYMGHLGDETDIIRAARMSTQKDFVAWDGQQICLECNKVKPKSFYTEEQSNLALCPHVISSSKTHTGDAKLLEYLYKNHHMTPFEMLDLRIQVKAPIFVFREWHRHRTQSYNEMSARYIQMPDEHYVPEPRWQDQKNKQGSIVMGENYPGDWKIHIQAQQEQIYDHYEESIKEGIAKEVARINTPVSRYSIMWAKANLRNWLQFLQLRMAPNAQWEIRQYANAVASIIKEIWPRTYALFEEYTLNSETLSASEIKFLRQSVFNVVEVSALSEEDQKRYLELEKRLAKW
jgi:thymidylate synthase (FAD)